mgnify:CR=1 FL=1
MSPQSTKYRRPTRGLWALLAVCLCLTMALSVPGCSGCRRDSTAEKKKKEEDKKKKEREKKEKLLEKEETKKKKAMPG